MKIRYFTHLNEEGTKIFEEKTLQYWDDDYKVWSTVPEIEVHGDITQAMNSKNYESYED